MDQIVVSAPRARTFALCCGGNLAATLLIWTLYLITIRPAVLALEPKWLSWVVGEGIRFSAFVVPTIVMIWRNPYDSFRVYEGMFRRGWPGIRWGLGAGGLLIILNAAAAYCANRTWAACAERMPDALAVALGTGVVFEELTYRGYFARNLCAEISSRVGYLGSAAAFVSIHCPGWFLAMDLPAGEVARRAVYIFLFGLALAYVLRRSGSIYAPLLLHAANNFASIVFWK